MGYLLTCFLEGSCTALGVFCIFISLDVSIFFVSASPNGTGDGSYDRSSAGIHRDGEVSSAFSDFLSGAEIFERE